MSWDNSNATASPPLFTDPPRRIYVVQWTEGDGSRWYYEHDDDGSPAMFILGWRVWEAVT